MPMMLQCLNIIRNNLFVVHKNLINHGQNDKDLHKKVSLEMIGFLEPEQGKNI